MKNISFISITIAIASGLVSCSNRNSMYDATGIFEATEVVVSAKTQGEIVALACEEGDEINANISVGCIDTTMLSLQKRALLANQNATTTRQLDVSAQIASLKQQRSNFLLEKERFERLLKKGACSQKTVDDIDYQLQVIDKQIVALEDQVKSNNRSLSSQGSALEAQVLQIQKQLDDCIIKSPISGTILNKYFEKGEYVVPGKPIFKVADISQMRLRAYITAPQLTTIKIGQKVTVYADLGETDQKAYEGIITWISDKAEFTPKTIQTRDERANLIYAIKVSVENDGLIKRGMYGNVSFN